jgi:hypothetical protein
MEICRYRLGPHPNVKLWLRIPIFFTFLNTCIYAGFSIFPVFRQQMGVRHLFARLAHYYYILLIFMPQFSFFILRLLAHMLTIIFCKLAAYALGFLI